MPDPIITNNSVVGVVISDPVYDDDVVTFAGAGTKVAGTIMARSTATLKLIDFVKGGSTNGNGIPCAVLPVDLVATGAGDVTSKVILGGKVRLNKLVIVADGDSSNIDAAVRDQLRQLTIIPLSAPTQLAGTDNQ